MFYSVIRNPQISINSLRETKRCVYSTLYNHVNAIKKNFFSSLLFSLHCNDPFSPVILCRVVMFEFWMEQQRGASKICFINKLLRRMFARQQTQDFCLFYLLSSTHYLFSFLCIHTSSYYYCKQKNVNMIFQIKIKAEQKTKLFSSSFTSIFRTYLLCYISFIGLFCLHTPKKAV